MVIADVDEWAGEGGSIKEYCIMDLDFLKCVEFFNKISISVNDITSDTDASNKNKVVIVEYRYENKVFTTKPLYYKEITDLDNVRDIDWLHQYFEGDVYWLDIGKHKWPKGSGESDLDQLVIGDIANDRDVEFKEFLLKLARNNQTGYIQKITKQGRPGQYYHNLENNNHWHDLVLWIKEAIKNNGKNISKKYFQPIIFNWDKGKRTSINSGNPYKIVTDFNSNIIRNAPAIKMIENINLLQYKKQIILQGPPGTGKTREAKEIAKKIIPLTVELVKNKITVGKVIPTAKGQVSYKVLSLTDDKIILEREKGTPNDTSISRIITAYNEQKWKNEITNNDDRMAVAVAKFLYDDFFKDNEQFKLIQFHPSYTYEDFVRGIVAKPNEDGEGIIYDAENKILGEFAKKALENYKAATIESEEIELSLRDFTNHIISIIDEQEKFQLSDKVYIYYVDDRRFKYKGDNWTAHPNGLNMNFSEIQKIIDFGLTTRQEINKNTSLNALTRQHATYFQKFIELFDAYKANNKGNRIKKEVLKNYVLVIDEINRANLSSVLGELIYALEYRGEAVDSMYAVEDSILSNKNHLILPPNLFIIGTMNTADRSVGHIDYAIRRRFAFVDVLPQKLADTSEIYFNTNGFEAVEKLFTDAEESTDLKRIVSNEFEIKDVQIGHSYFIAKKEDLKEDAQKDAIFRMKMDYEVKPILREYLRDGIFNSDKKIGELSIKEYIEQLS